MSRILALTVPRWGMAMEEGTLIGWLKQEGQVVADGDDVAELESSKIVNVLQSHSRGTLRRHVASEGQTLPVGALLGVISDADVPDAEIDAFITSFRPAPNVATVQAPDAGPEIAAPRAEPVRVGAQAVIPGQLQQGGDDSAAPASPHARRFAREHGINLNNIKGSGRGGRIQIEDVEQAIVAGGGSLPVAAPARPTAAHPAPDVVEEAPLAGMRQTIAKRLKEAKLDAPHFRLVAEVRADALLAARAKLKSAFPEAGITVNDLLVKCCAAALMEVPACNVQFDGRVLKRFRNADIAVAVAVDAGLITPIVRAANLKSAREIAAETRALVARAKSGALKSAEYEGGSFTVSNLGMFGVRQFDAIINRPQAAILAAGRIEQRVIAREGTPAIANMWTLTLSCDHRVIDGATGARFLQALAAAIEDPSALVA
jgi:pyruvate dehydrogenase E2 component (dihydrolipoamide acetyltransferase)